ncbi:MAG: hypothetical protein J6X70_01600 [Muribaculaceae bacterium]|nr:hypothetical protein [Muribaculaceae bacterium]
MKKLLLMFMAAASISMAAQETLTVADGTDTHSWFPYASSRYWSIVGSRSQVLYPADMLTDMIGADITSMKFYVVWDNGMWMSGGKSRISLATTTKTKLWNSFEEDGLTVVASNVPGPLPNTYEVEIVFDKPFTYAGGNLLYDWVLTEAGDYTTYTTNFHGTRINQYVSLFLPGGDDPKYINYDTFIPKTTFTYEKVFITTKSLDFGQILPNSEKVLTVDVKNINSTSVTPVVSGLSGPFSTDYTPRALASGQTMQIPIKFKPEEDGDYTGSVTITCAGESYQVNLAGSCKGRLKLTVCDGTATNFYVPFCSMMANVTNSFGQAIYPAEKLAAVKGHKIKSLTFYTAEPFELHSPTLTLSVKETSQTEFGNQLTDLTAMGTLVPIDGTTEMKFIFNEPYTYNGNNFGIQVKITKARGYDAIYFLGEGQNANTGFSLYYIGSGQLYETQYVPFLPKMTIDFADDFTNFAPYNKLTAYNFNIPSNTIDNEGVEGYAKLFDKRSDTKWCVCNNSGGWQTTSVDFKSDVPFIPEGYIFTTGNDTKKYYMRNPKAWTIYAKANVSDEWTVLTSVTNGSELGLGTENQTDYKFTLNNTQAYQYFRFEVSEIGGKNLDDNNYVFQLAELAFWGDEADASIAGDVNGDGVVSGADVTALYNVLLDNATVAGDADVNGDGIVNGSDVTALYNLLLN